MKNRFYILSLLLLLSCMAFGQKKMKKQSGPQYQVEKLVDQARRIKDKDPKKAISLLGQAISTARKSKAGLGMEGEAYFLLGGIYEQIDQKELAIQRYEQALPYYGSIKDMSPKAPILERIGRLSLALGDDKKAEENFTTCINLSDDKSLTLICEEGIADVQLSRRDTSAIFTQLDNIPQNYTLDSAAVSRNQARRAQAYLQQNKYDQASNSLQSSINTALEDSANAKEALPQIQIAQEEFLNYSQNIKDKIEIASNTVGTELFKNSNDELIRQNLKVAELYESGNDYDNAEAFVNSSKELIKPTTPAAIKADIYKKSSEYNQRRGLVDEALNDLELFITAKEQSIQDLENNLKEQVEIVKGQQDIDISQRDYDIQTKEQELMSNQLKTQQIIIGLLSMVLIASLVFFYFLYKNVKAKRKANQLLLLKSLRTQMNPHFIFNALNSVNNFIAKNDEKSANKFLSEFSKLMRKVLDNSQKDFITFEEEVELNELYLKLEHFRFRDKFDYTFKNNAMEHGYSLEVPPMLIQPFIENAVWHGLRYKEEKGKLNVEISESGKHLIITIKDNGIGRKKSQLLKTSNQKKYKSTGLDNVSRRIALINEIYGKNYTIEVTDLKPDTEDTGTQVDIKIPVE